MISNDMSGDAFIKKSTEKPQNWVGVASRLLQMGKCPRVVLLQKTWRLCPFAHLGLGISLLAVHLSPA